MPSAKCSRGVRKGTKTCRRKPGPKRSRGRSKLSVTPFGAPIRQGGKRKRKSGGKKRKSSGRKRKSSGKKRKSRK